VTKNKQKIEIKSITSKAVQYRHMLLYVNVVNYNVNSNFMKYFALYCGRIFTFCKISTTNLRILWRHLPT